MYEHINHPSLSGSVFTTSDLCTVAVLLCEGFHITGKQKDGTRAVFQFNNSEQLKEVVSNYWRNNLKCEAHGLLASYRRAKQILYDGDF